MANITWDRKHLCGCNRGRNPWKMAVKNARKICTVLVFRLQFSLPSWPSFSLCTPAHVLMVARAYCHKPFRLQDFWDEEFLSLSLLSYECLPGFDPNIIHTHFLLHSRVKEPSLMANRASRVVSSGKTFQLFLCSFPINFMSMDSLQYWSLKKKKVEGYLPVFCCVVWFFFLITPNN